LVCDSPPLDPRIERILIPADEIQHRVKELADQISHDYASSDLHLICILKGAYFFCTDLARYIPSPPLSLDFLAIWSYGSSTQTSGEVRVTKDLDHSLQGRNVLVVEDIIDTGLTMKYILELLKARGPNSLKVATLLDKSARRRVQVPLDYVGFTIPSVFVAGYGLDCDQFLRNLPYICVLKPEALPR